MRKGKIDIMDNIGELVVVDKINEFISLIKLLKNEGEDIEGKYITNLRIEASDLSKIECADNIFEKCVFNKVVFQKSYFKNCYFKNCDFSNCDFSNSTFSNCTFQNVKCLGTDFSEGVFKDTCIKECVFKYAVFTFSLFNVCDIEKSDMSEAYMDNCKLKKLILSDVNLIRANFYKTLLKGIDLRNCQIDGIILSTEAKELNGAVVEMFQAAELAKMLGVIIK